MNYKLNKSHHSTKHYLSIGLLYLLKSFEKVEEPRFSRHLIWGKHPHPEKARVLIFLRW